MFFVHDNQFCFHLMTRPTYMHWLDWSESVNKMLMNERKWRGVNPHHTTLTFKRAPKSPNQADYIVNLPTNAYYYETTVHLGESNLPY